MNGMLMSNNGGSPGRLLFSASACTQHTLTWVHAPRTTSPSLNSESVLCTDSKNETLA